MNELSVIGSLHLHKDFCDYHRENIASCLKKIDGKKLFQRPKKLILKGDECFFMAVLS